MKNTYSIYEARSKFSAIIRAVMEQQTAIITYRGRPVVKLIPYQASDDYTIEDRILELVGSKQLEDAIAPLPELQDIPAVEKVGALERFFKDRE